jgi:amidophosphoribosyltransferase
MPAKIKSKLKRWRLRENCGIFGIYGIEEAATLTYLGLYALQHRGQESAGIVSADGKKIHSVLKMGLVADVFNKKNLKKLTGPMAIGHIRYSTTGASFQANIQPIYAYYKDGF